MLDVKQLVYKHREIESFLEKSLKELSDLKFALDASSIVAITDHKGRIIYANDKFCEISKYSRGELLGQTHRIVNSSYHPKEFFRNLWRTIVSGKVWKAEIRNKAKDGTMYWVDTTIIPFLNEKGDPYQYVSIRNEITKRKEMEELMKQFPQRIIQAQELERENIAREIHDDLGQSLVTLKMLIQSVMLDSQISKMNAKKSYDKIVKYFDSVIEKVRDISFGLRPSTLEVLGLTAAIKTLVHDFKQNRGLEIQSRFIEQNKSIPIESIGLDSLVFKGEIINFYRIFQESFTNIAKHAKANKVKILMKKDQGKLEVIIKDNGKGFNLHDISRDILGKSPRGLGLSIMRERARLLGGDLQIISQVGEGTIVTFIIPVNGEAAKNA